MCGGDRARNSRQHDAGAFCGAFHYDVLTNTEIAGGNPNAHRTSGRITQIRAELEATGQKIGPTDLFIAAHALSTRVIPIGGDRDPSPPDCHGRRTPTTHVLADGQRIFARDAVGWAEDMDGRPSPTMTPIGQCLRRLV